LMCAADDLGAGALSPVEEQGGSGGRIGVHGGLEIIAESERAFVQILQPRGWRVKVGSGALTLTFIAERVRKRDPL
jgi:hypothetical protein